MTSPEELKRKIKTEPTDGPRIPVTDFEGELKEWRVEVVPADPKNDRKEGLRCVFDFIDITVIETREPYALPTIPISVFYSEGKNTGWMGLMDSFKEVVPAEDRAAEEAESGNSINILVGKRQRWQWGPMKLRRILKDENDQDVVDEKGKKVWGVVVGSGWLIKSVEGFETVGGIDRPSYMDLVVDFAVGKDDKAVGTWLFTASELKGYGREHNEAVEAFTDGRKLMKGLVLSGRLEIDPDTGLYVKGAVS